MEASALQKSMKMAMSKCTKESEDEQTTRKKDVDWFVFLPDDILLDILKRVPHDFLRYKAKYVSRRWFNIITHNILRNHASLILESSNVIYTTRFVNIREEQEGLEVEEQYLDIPPIGRMRSWCNEFLLISIYNNEKSLYVYNLITKEGSYLPQCKASCGLGRYGLGHYDSTCRLSLSYDGFKGIYKVVHLVMGSPIQCEILGLIERDIVSRVSSKWKNMEVPFMNVGRFWHEPVSVQGRYLHWKIDFPDCLLSIDTVKEQIFQVSLPGYGSLFEMGGFLALFHRVSYEKIEIWILKNIQRMKWEKLQSLTLQNWRIRMHPNGTWNLNPVCAVISKRYVILENIFSKRLLSYDLKYGIMKELDILREELGDRCVVHSSAPSFK